MKHTPLPRDLAAYVRRARLCRILPCCLLEVLMVALLLFLGNRLFGKEVLLVYRILIYIVLLALPFFLTKFPWNLRERTFRGVVRSVSFERTFSIGGGKARPLSRGGMMMFHTEGGHASVMCLDVQLADGRTIRQKLPVPRHPNTPPAEGAEVFHLFGSDHVITLPTPADDHIHCAVCNDINPPDAAVCRSCGRTMAHVFLSP